MTKMKGILFVAAFAAYSSLANAGAYVGAGASVINYDVSGVDDTNVGVVNVVLGSNITENVAVELRAGNTFDVGIDKYLGVYTKLGAQLNNGFYPYAIIGYTRAEVEISFGGYDFSDSDGDLSYGLGMRIGAAADTNFSIEYIRYFEKGDGELSGLALSITTPF